MSATWQKAKCGCWVERREGHWIVAANSFLCSAHRQGDSVSDRFAPSASVSPGGSR